MVQVGNISAAQVNQKSAVENKNTKAQATDFNFSSALSKLGKDLVNFVPQINANAKSQETDLKKIKAVSEELKEGLPTIEDEANELISKIEKLMEEHGDK
ncbi:hypothetical protein ACFL4F_02720 [Candidatus Margulisiibacteriota bacterium]